MSAFSSTMSAVRPSREFIRERLTAAAEEIFTEVEKTIVRYEEDIRSSGVYWKPRIKLTRIEQLEQHVRSNKKEVSTDPKLWNQQTSSSPDQEEPEPPQIKQEPEPADLRRNQEEFCCKPQLTRTDLSPQQSCKENEVQNQETDFTSDQEEPESFEYEDDGMLQLELLPYDSSAFMPPSTSHQSIFSQPEPAAHQEQKETYMSCEEERKWFKAEPITMQLHHQNPPEHQQSIIQLHGSFSGVTPHPDQTEQECDWLRAEPYTDCLAAQNQDWVGSSSAELDPSRIQPSEEALCQTCGKYLTSSAASIRHMRTHTQERPYECELCKKRFLSSKSLITHKRNHYKKPFPCKICGKVFRKKPFHQRVVTKHWCLSYSCKLCNKVYQSKGMLTNHIKFHEREEESSCSVCGKKYYLKKKLVTHMRSHEVKKPHRCEKCGSEFPSEEESNSHMSGHTSEKLYPCDVCGRSFYRRATQLTHLKDHMDKGSWPRKRRENISS